MALAIVRQHQIYIASESGYGLDSEFAVDDEPEEQTAGQREESPEEGEERDIREGTQRRRQEGGRVTRVGGRESGGGADDAAERAAGQQNLTELKASLENRSSVLMTTAFML